ncbi:hypothetical protein [Francisella sp. XLW-1]|uniref:hypothetical protein n=1 Tax=Francisella sp. XLW-1 TaxID=2610887 RepID=UPI00123DF099|nr:hypothetical protein [Francisella sp. XLW-1]
MIDCDISKWPIVKMHFGSSPSYKDVLSWLDKCSQILKKQQKFLVISTFSEQYQFEHKARLKQAKWFKESKPELAKWCLGMIRVTNDPIMIKKINAPAMAKGMPFSCIAVDNTCSAWEKAQQILIEDNLI